MTGLSKIVTSVLLVDSQWPLWLVHFEGASCHVGEEHLRATSDQQLAKNGGSRSNGL